MKNNKILYSILNRNHYQVGSVLMFDDRYDCSSMYELYEKSIIVLSNYHFESSLRFCTVIEDFENCERKIVVESFLDPKPILSKIYKIKILK